MIIEPKFRNNVCLTAHPVGCALQVKEQIGYVKSRGKITGPENVLVVGSSNGYGLASRIVAHHRGLRPRNSISARIYCMIFSDVPICSGLKRNWNNPHLSLLFRI